jgi:hypothetical protein
MHNAAQVFTSMATVVFRLGSKRADLAEVARPHGQVAQVDVGPDGRCC